jgi:hypothetical protein
VTVAAAKFPVDLPKPGVDWRLQGNAAADDGHDQDGEAAIHRVIFADPACQEVEATVLMKPSGTPL